MCVGTRIKDRRKELKISADDLAKYIGVSRATIFRYENGDIEKMPAKTLELIAEYLRTTPAFLMGWDKEQPETIAAHKRDNLTEEEQKAVDAFIQGLIANRKN